MSEPTPDSITAEELNHLDEAQAPAAAELASLNIYQRMHRAASMVSVLVKSKTCGEGNYGFKYVSHDDTVGKVRLAFQPCGILAIMTIDNSSLAWETGVDKYGKPKVTFTAQLTASMTFINIDKPEDRFTVTVPAYALDNSDKAMGKAMSYAKKYAIIAMSGLMLATGEDVDQNNLEMEALRGDAQTPQNAPRGATASQRPNTRQTAPKADTPPAGKPVPAPEAPAIPADKERAKELLGQYADADLQALDIPILLALSDAYAVMLGCPAGDFATRAIETKYAGRTQKPGKTVVLNGAHRLSTLYIYWRQLCDAVLARHDGNQEAYKAALRELVKEKGWGDVWLIQEPGDVKAAIQLFTDEQ